MSDTSSSVSRPQALPLLRNLSDPPESTPPSGSGTTGSSSSSSGSSAGLCSTGEQTVIRNELGSSSTESSTAAASNTTTTTSDVPEAGTEPLISIDAAGSAIPPILLDLMNKAYVGLNFYDKLKEQNADLHLDTISSIFSEVDKEFASDDGHDDQVLITSLAAKYVQALEAGSQNAGALQADLTNKLEYINELLVQRTEQVEANLKNMKIQDE